MVAAVHSLLLYGFVLWAGAVLSGKYYIAQCDQDEQGEHYTLIICFNKIILDMFRTNNCASSEGLYKQLTVFYCASL